jgi:amino acid adenylation domain-containing protein
VSTQQDNTAGLVSFRLSPQQELLRSLAGVGAISQLAAVLPAGTDLAALRPGLERAVERYEILRTTIVTPAGVRTPQQVIHERLAPEWNARAGAAGGADPELLAEALASEAAAGLDVEHGPLIRGLLLSSPAHADVLILTACAAAADAPSLLALAEELASAGEPPAEPIQYADYAEWRHQLIVEQDDAAQEGRSHWRSAEWPPTPRVLFGTAVATRTSAPAEAVIAIRLGADTLERLAGAAAASGVSTAIVLEAAWHALIGRLTGTGELMLAHCLDGRAQEDLAGAVGPYAQPVPIHTRAQDGTSFAEIVDQVRRGRADAAGWQDYASAVELGELARQAPAAFAALDTATAPSVAIPAATPALPGVPLLLHCLGRDGDLRIELRHDPAVFDAADAAEIAASLQTLLAAAVRDPQAPVARLHLIDSAQRARLLAHDTQAPAGDATTAVHHRFEEQARRTPERPAVTGPGGTLSYGELNERANRLAHHLRDCGVAPGVAVGMCMERTPAMLTALLAILKAGGAYVPLNLEHPPARLADQLSRARAPVIVTHERLLERLGGLAETVACPERDAGAIAARPSADPAPAAGPDDLVYVMYTSGSTGAPKGVEVTHRNLANYTAYMAARLAAAVPAQSDHGDGLAFAVVSAISTDLGNTAIFPALATGGCLHLIDTSAAMDGDAYAAYAAEHPIDVLKITPSHLRALLGSETPQSVLPRGVLVLGGEALSWELVARIRSLEPTCAILNHYGPTETTIGCATYDVDETARADAATVPIGTPIAGAWAYVLDTALEPVPAGVPGELVVGGAGVANGYAGDPSETAERFVADPGEHSRRAYRTGDRVRRLRDGAIEFLGRVDDQVKIRGYRVEPGEIEAVLARHPDVRQAAVAVDDAGGEPRLVAYLVAAKEPSVEELQTFLAVSLPEYMVPSAFATLEALPFTASGKIDRRSLAGLAAVQTRRETEFVAPRDELEREIAAIWCALLGVEQVGVFDDFFALGGHSLLATQAIIRIRRVHGQIPLRALLAAPTIAAVADVVRAGGTATA